MVHPFSLRIALLVAGLVAASLLAGAVTPVVAAPPEGFYSKVQGVRPGSALWIRDAPQRSAKRIGFLPFNARHIRTYTCQRFVTGRWCEVNFRGTRGWASERYLARDRARRV